MTALPRRIPNPSADLRVPPSRPAETGGGGFPHPGGYGTQIGGGSLGGKNPRTIKCLQENFRLGG